MTAINGKGEKNKIEKHNRGNCQKGHIKRNQKSQQMEKKRGHKRHKYI